MRAAGDALVSTGMRDAGYVYVNIDDTWQGNRDANGVLHPNERFPDMKALAAYIHAKGLKFGIYSSPGPRTCAGYKGSIGHEEQDARMYADWGVDFLKYDLCSLQEQMQKLTAEHNGDVTDAEQLMISAYRRMGDALKKEGTRSGRPILYSLCEYGLAEPWLWGPSVHTQMWRTTDDIRDSYRRMIVIGLERADLTSFSGPDHWNDPDMLEVGNGGMTAAEYKTDMGLWALLSAPLLAGNDLTKMSDTDRRILTNREVIAIDQDPAGKQARRLYQHGDSSVWIKPLANGSIAVGMFNNGEASRPLSFDLRRLGLGDEIALRDLWKEEELGRHGGIFSRDLPAHGSMLIVARR